MDSAIELAERVAARLSQIDGVTAVVLGGSRAGGTARADSDIDLGLYYEPRCPPSVDALNQLAHTLDSRHPHDAVTEFGEWGLYHDALVGIDAARMLNNGQPSAHAFWMDQLDLREGEHMVHVGCGTGYYTAILADVVGASGRVTAVEMDADLAERARANLAHLPYVRVVHGDGAAHDPGGADVFYINAGATHPQPLWLDRLLDAGRLMLPLVRWPADSRNSVTSGVGILLKVTRHHERYSAAIISPVGIFPCIGGVDADADRRLGDALAQGVDTRSVRSLRRDVHGREPACWLHGDHFCLSTAPA